MSVTLKKFTFTGQKAKTSIFVIFVATPLKGVVVALKGAFNSELSQKYKSLHKFLLLFNIFKQKSCILKKSKVTDGSSNQKRAYKSEKLFF
jgi:hypothetical protein